MDATVIGADPENTLFPPARRDRDNAGVIFRRRNVVCQTAALAECLHVRVVRCQVIADHSPRVAAVDRLVKILAAVVNRRCVEGILREACIPVEAEVDIQRLRVRSDKTPLAGIEIPASQIAALRHHITAP